MIPEGRARRVQELFDAACTLLPGARRSFLRDACGAEPELMRDVEELLSFLDDADTDRLFPPVFQDIPEVTLEGRQVGSYHVLKKIGGGGMGSVYLAERADQQFRKRVALKVIKPGMDSEDLLRRFRSERQILAGLEHPNIARLLDGGLTEDRRPYFVMEYVEGQPISEHCDRHRLSVSERLRLFLDVCSAVQYAHQNLIVHRDLKPGNILVTSAGEVKLVDFGIAKLLNATLVGFSVPMTRAEVRLMTPEYAAPEQILGNAITTATDVYALGVLLYELLSGHRPYRVVNRTQHEIERVICENEPEKPSSAVMRDEEVVGEGDSVRITPEKVSRARQSRPDALRRRLGGDLDKIVLKTMRKEPQHRYESVGLLSEDITMHLTGRPVSARPATVGYRMRKFVRRYRVGVAAAALVVLSLAGGLTLALSQNKIARAQRDLALQAAGTMITELSEGLSSMTGPTESRLGLLAQAAKVYEEINITSQIPTHQLWQRADAHRKLAHTYWYLGDVEKALFHVERAEELGRQSAGHPAAPAEARVTLASVLSIKATVLATAGRNVEAIDAGREATEFAERAIKEDPKSPAAYRWLIQGLIAEGDLLYDGEPEDATRLYRRAYDTAGELLGLDGAHPEHQSFRATSSERLADMLYYAGEVEQSCVTYREALSARRRAEQLAAGASTPGRSLKRRARLVSDGRPRGTRQRAA